jgi:hypothetical protein
MFLKSFDPRLRNAAAENGLTSRLVYWLVETRESQDPRLGILDRRRSADHRRNGICQREEVPDGGVTAASGFGNLPARSDRSFEQRVELVPRHLRLHGDERNTSLLCRTNKDLSLFASLKNDRASAGACGIRDQAS